MRTNPEHRENIQPVVYKVQTQLEPDIKVQSSVMSPEFGYLFMDCDCSLLDRRYIS